MRDFLKSIRHILLINLKYLGDSIWMLPLVENLKKNLPDVELSVLVNKGTEDFFYTCPYINNVIPFPRSEIKGKRWGFIKFILFALKLRKLKPNMVIDLTETDRATILSYLSGARFRISYCNEKSWRQLLLTHRVNSRIHSKHMVEYLLDTLRYLDIRIFESRIKINIPKEAFQSLERKFPTIFNHNSDKKKLLYILEQEIPYANGVQKILHCYAMLYQKNVEFFL
ncbi:Lipopolysaccharide heptosyltransferase III [Thermodesulfovibrio sp. N1]|uniref:glycosyltransferase family 9 protein n=1 Tax=Thermodesulfovibrio sp. N1 TaxID=1871110 RepID=UPI00083B6D73|nr:glycosyltransferase family 9 protein [Thermodesulfovibrio sp. N1]ODA44829.1 Lipopolysaccharide heptosyltransferase III [Thermodesulfovibrio sp. N1]